jgi:hypothetical protein
MLIALVFLTHSLVWTLWLQERAKDAVKSLETCLQICNRMEIDTIRSILLNLDVLKHIGLVLCIHSKSEPVGHYALDLLSYIFQGHQSLQPIAEFEKAWGDKEQEEIFQCLEEELVSHRLSEERMQVVCFVFHTLLLSMSLLDLDNYTIFAISLHDSGVGKTLIDGIDGELLRRLNDCDSSEDNLYCSAHVLEYIMMLESEGVESHLLLNVFNRFDALSETEWGTQWETKRGINRHIS